MEGVIETQLADLYPRIEILESTGSTNADLLAGEAPHRAVLIARHQDAGRGRLGRPWSAPADTQLILSVRLNVTDPARLGTLPLAAGVALRDVVTSATLKWPNDVLIGGRKLCGILAEAVADERSGFKVVLGVGLNHLLRREDLPVPHATSLALEGIDLTREELTVQVLTALHRRLSQWEADDPQLMADYRAVCSSIGQRVRLETPTGDVEGTVTAVAEDGRIIIDGEAFAAGDVTHLRLQGQ